MQIIFTGHDLTEAHIVAGMLRAEGIDAHVGGHYLQGAVGDLAPLDFARVLVPTTDVEQAERLIEEYNHGRETSDERPPPRDQPQFNAALMGGLILLVLFLFLLSWSA